MKTSPALLILFFLGLTARAAEPASSGPLTTREIASGWIELFDGKTLFGWKAPTESRWIIHDSLAPRADTPGLLVTTAAFLDFEISLEYLTRKDSSGSLVVGCDPRANKLESAGLLRLERMGSGWCHLYARVHGRTFVEHCFCCEKNRRGLRHVPPQGERPEPGHIALMGNGFLVRNIKLRPLNLDPLQAGTDLAAWRTESRSPADASATSGGLLLRKGSPLLLSKAEYRDFVLQTEFTAREAPADGAVLIRTDPDVPERGYLVRLRGQSLLQPAQEYTLDLYDSKTHDHHGQMLVRSNALDYGTGGLARLMPARSGGIGDQDWIALTILAQGRHFATWVNGVQQLDWTDHRPRNSDARLGYRTERGVVGLQARATSGNLVFRNLRIDALPVNDNP